MAFLPCLSWGSCRVWTVFTMLAMASNARPGISAREGHGGNVLDEDQQLQSFSRPKVKL